MPKPIKAVFYSYASGGGCVELEGDECNSFLLVQSNTASATMLRRRAAARLRTIADQLDAAASRRSRADGSVDVFPALS